MNLRLFVPGHPGSLPAVSRIIGHSLALDFELADLAAMFGPLVVRGETFELPQLGVSIVSAEGFCGTPHGRTKLQWDADRIFATQLYGLGLTVTEDDPFEPITAVPF